LEVALGEKIINPSYWLIKEEKFVAEYSKNHYGHLPYCLFVDIKRTRLFKKTTIRSGGCPLSSNSFCKPK
jgi:hypothetical protein